LQTTNTANAGYNMPSICTIPIANQIVDFIV